MLDQPAKKITHHGGCHCGAVRFEFQAPAAVAVTDCNCSMCRMSAYEHIFVPHADLHFTAGEDDLVPYQFNTRQAVHMFCSTCGIKPLYRPRSHPDAWSVNYRCVDAGTMKVAKRIAFDGADWDSNIAGLREET